jgi:Lipase (class 3)
MKYKHAYLAIQAAAFVQRLEALVSSRPTSMQRLASTLQSDKYIYLDIRHRSSELRAQSQVDLGIPYLEFGKVDAFDLNVALFCGGLAFDSYVEPPSNSTRWERGSKGMNVAFLSQAFTRSLYTGLVEITPIKCSGLPDEDDQLESLISGGGVDASIMVAAIEGQWKEDIALLKQEYHEGILDLSGAAHIGKSSTAWSNVDERRSTAEKKKSGKAPPYHIKKSWGRDASAVWPEPDPFYLYVQDPANVLLLFTLFDDDVIGEGSAIGSTYTPLSKILPQVSYSQDETIKELKSKIVEKIQRGEMNADDIEEEVLKAVQEETQAWEGDLKLTSKPRMKNKNSQIAAGAAVGAFVAGPVGAALGAGLGSIYEGQIKGRITVRIRYLPIPKVTPRRNRYVVTGGMPGIDWGSLYEMFLTKEFAVVNAEDKRVADQTNPGGNDLEHCFFINHSETGGCCAVYRSLEKKLLVISFRGTCTPIDLVTDASIVQDTWIEGDDAKSPETPKVHGGFRRSLNSISRRLKELVLAAVGPGHKISDYDVLVTGHSLVGLRNFLTEFRLFEAHHCFCFL